MSDQPTRLQSFPADNGHFMREWNMYRVLLERSSPAAREEAAAIILARVNEISVTALEIHPPDCWIKEPQAVLTTRPGPALLDAMRVLLKSPSDSLGVFVRSARSALDS